MAAIHIHREHHLGLERAREIAWRWAEDAEARLGMECTVYEGEDSDTIEFTRSGVKGELVVTSTTFELKAKLGLLMGALRGTIESEIEKELDQLLAAQAGKAAKSTKKRK